MFSLFRQSKRPARSQLATDAMTPATAVQEDACLHLERACLRAEAGLGRDIPRPTLRFDIRGKTAGMAYSSHNLIRLNPKLLEENPDIFYTEVIPHELCHLLAHSLHGKVKPHGKEWQALMRGLFGLSPRTTHSLDTSSVSRSIEYRCQCGPVPLSVRRHNKIVRGETRYLCRRCGDYLKQPDKR
ncbi:SprT family zinc-dependent metalloprotease [Shewanella zhangzhouensis]|uniref:SprT family zinc-dependent metalloprotease n=1 Tax=Shewanella zhangzhouensis TaxID=2864213 RepID=UPI001C65CB07|nr:SprT family zinc-dependent metalloprotease [Shewanella zhangzhouensis]QYK05877.1 SprT family zinc-dependent metalloprotease [Shewanella zhangzhouensis]